MPVQKKDSLRPKFSYLLLSALILFIGNSTSAAPKVLGKLTFNQPINGQLNERSDIKKEDSENPRVALFQIQIDPTETSTIDAESEQFNTHLRLIDSKGQTIIEDDDGGIGHNARLIIHPSFINKSNKSQIKDIYLELTSQGKWDVGAYKISMAKGEITTPQGKDKIQASITYCEQAAKLAESKKALHRQGWVLGSLAWNLSLIGRYDELREQAQRVKSIAEQIGDKKLLAFALKNIGAASWYQGRPKEALPYFEQALEIRREIRDRKGEANSLDNLGIAYQQMREPKRAIQCFEESLKIYRELGDQRGESNELGNLGIAYYTIGDHTRAIDYYENALQIRRQVGDRRGEAYDLGNLGVAYAKLGEYLRAIAYYELAIKIHRELGDRHGEGRELENLAKACVYVGDMKRAVECTKEAKKIKQEINVQ